MAIQRNASRRLSMARETSLKSLIECLKFGYDPTRLTVTTISGHYTLDKVDFFNYLITSGSKFDIEVTNIATTTS